jgi:hypothetical protein
MKNTEFPYSYRTYVFVEKQFLYFDIGEDDSPYMSGYYGGLSVPQLFIGKYDSEKNPIYDGDILSFDYKPNEHGDVEKWQGEVFYDKDSAAFLLDRTGEFEFGHPDIFNIKVIGNVIENKKV